MAPSLSSKLVHDRALGCDVNHFLAQVISIIDRGTMFRRFAEGWEMVYYIRQFDGVTYFMQ